MSEGAIFWTAWLIITTIIFVLWLDSHRNMKKSRKKFFSECAQASAWQIEDTEANRCYSWEDAVVANKLRALGLGGVMTVATARKHIKVICAEMGYKMPQVDESDFDGLPTTGMSINGDYILLRKETDYMIVLHELAHMMLVQEGKLNENHGPLFIEKYIRLLEHVGCTGLRETLHAWALSPTPFRNKEATSSKHGNH